MQLGQPQSGYVNQVGGWLKVIQCLLPRLRYAW